MDYYLPTTVKLLEAYAEMDAQPVGGENIQTAKREIEATLDTLNVAFEKLLDSLWYDKKTPQEAAVLGYCLGCIFRHFSAEYDVGTGGFEG